MSVTADDIAVRLDAYLETLEVGDQLPPEAIDDFRTFLEAIRHQEGNAVEAQLDPAFFDDAALGDLVSADLIIMWWFDADAGMFVMVSDAERLTRFDVTSLLQLRVLRALAAVPHPSWAPPPSENGPGRLSELLSFPPVL